MGTRIEQIRELLLRQFVMNLSPVINCVQQVKRLATCIYIFMHLCTGKSGGRQHGGGHHPWHRIQDGGVQRPASCRWGMKRILSRAVWWISEPWCVNLSTSVHSVHQTEGGDLKGQGSSGQQGLRNRREHQAGSHHPAAGVAQTLWNGLQKGRRPRSHHPCSRRIQIRPSAGYDPSGQCHGFPQQVFIHILSSWDLKHSLSSSPFLVFYFKSYTEA